MDCKIFDLHNGKNPALTGKIPSTIFLEASTEVLLCALIIPRHSFAEVKK